MTPPMATVVADRHAARRWLDAQLDDGRRERPLSELPTAPWDLTDRRWATCAEPLDTDGVAAGVLAVVRGVAVVFVIPGDRAVAELLADELGRVLPTAPDDVAPVADPAPPQLAANLEPEAVELLTILAGGASTAEAAAAVHVSLRTAERRLTAARRALGVRSTAEAVRLVVGTSS